MQEGAHAAARPSARHAKRPHTRDEVVPPGPPRAVAGPERKFVHKGAAGGQRTVEQHEARQRHEEHQDGRDDDKGCVARVERRSALMCRTPVHVHGSDDPLVWARGQ